MGRVIYEGSVPETDPRYTGSRWNYLSGKNLNPRSKEKSAGEAQELAQRPGGPKVNDGET
jgi:hypothetical protein